MNINMTAQEIADTIAQGVTEATSLRCETFTDGRGNAVIITDHTHLAARVTPDRERIQVATAPFNPETTATSIPSKATTLSGLRKIATRIDDAMAAVTTAATATARQ